MMYYRRKIQLALLDAFGGTLGAKEFQTLLFLFTRAQDTKSYDFVPFRWGCYSFQAAQDIHSMEGAGLVRIDATPQGHAITLADDTPYVDELNLFDRKALYDIHSAFHAMSRDELLRYTYIHYPFHAINSVLKEDLLTPEECDAIKKQERHYSEAVLFTIGYEGVSLERYINKLIINDVHVLCDVRKNAFSQKYGFSKAQLKMACEGVGIEYMHVPQLGIDSDKRKDLKTQADYDALFDEYERTTLVNNHEALLKVKQVVDQRGRVALTCFEADPRQCHRSRVAAALMRLDDCRCKRVDIPAG